MSLCLKYLQACSTAASSLENLQKAFPTFDWDLQRRTKTFDSNEAEAPKIGLSHRNSIFAARQKRHNLLPLMVERDGVQRSDGASETVWANHVKTNCFTVITIFEKESMEEVYLLQICQQNSRLLFHLKFRNLSLCCVPLCARICWQIGLTL